VVIFSHCCPYSTTIVVAGNDDIADLEDLHCVLDDCQGGYV